jgi:hypothetical protein
MAATIAKNSSGAIGSGDASKKRRQLTRRGRARASAYRPQAKIFRPSRAIDQVAMSFLPFRMNIRANVFAASPVDWLCVACWIGKRAIRRGVGSGVVSA